MKMADKIHALRKEKGLSQEQLAESLGVSRQSVSKWESGQSVPDLDKILPLSKLFAVSTDFLLDEDAERSQALPQPKSQTTLRIVRITATAGNAVGLILALVSVSISSAWTEPLFLIGWFGQIIQCALYEATLAWQLSSNQRRACRAKFYRSNVWLLAWIPAYVLSSVAFRVVSWPYPSVLPTLAALVLSLIVCVSATAYIQKKQLAD